MLTYHHAGTSEMPLEVLTKSFVAWFEGEPWLERFRCPSCNGFCDFGSTGRYAEWGNGLCEVCGTALMPYWSLERVVEYYFDAARRQGFNQILGKDEQGVVQSWAWGYDLRANPGFEDMPAGGFYGDHVGVASEYRGVDSFDIMVRGWEILEGLGFRYMVIRTHQQAEYVREFLNTIGFNPLDHHASEPDRVYMVWDPTGSL